MSEGINIINESSIVNLMIFQPFSLAKMSRTFVVLHMYKNFVPDKIMSTLFMILIVISVENWIVDKCNVDPH